jgi:hypothetical protein
MKMSSFTEGLHNYHWHTESTVQIDRINQVDRVKYYEAS